MFPGSFVSRVRVYFLQGGSGKLVNIHEGTHPSLAGSWLVNIHEGTHPSLAGTWLAGTLSEGL